MATGRPGSEDGHSRAVRTSLTDLIAIETGIVDAVERWADALRDSPEAATTIGRLRTTSKSHRDELDDTLSMIAGSARPSASDQPIMPVPTESASEALRRAAEAAVVAAFACEAAYQTAGSRATATRATFCRRISAITRARLQKPVAPCRRS
jgi:hypothetical protein